MLIHYSAIVLQIDLVNFSGCIMFVVEVNRTMLILWRIAPTKDTTALYRSIGTVSSALGTIYILPKYGINPVYSSEPRVSIPCST